MPTPTRKTKPKKIKNNTDPFAVFEAEEESAYHLRDDPLAARQIRAKASDNLRSSPPCTTPEPFAAPAAAILSSAVVGGALALFSIPLTPFVVPFTCVVVTFSALRQSSRWTAAVLDAPLHLKGESPIADHLEDVIAVADYQKKNKSTINPFNASEIESLLPLSAPTARTAAALMRTDLENDAKQAVTSLNYAAITAMAGLASILLIQPSLFLSSTVSVSLMSAAVGLQLFSAKKLKSSIRVAVAAAQSDINKFEEASAGLPSLQDRLKRMPLTRPIPGRVSDSKEKLDSEPNITPDVKPEPETSSDSRAKRASKP